MRRMKDTFLVLLAATALVFATGCADDSPSTETGAGGAAGAGAATGAGGAGGSAGEGGAGGEGGSAGSGGEGGAAGEGGMGGGEPPACDDTAPLAEAAVGEYGPATRVTSLEIPRRPDEADALGCATVGTNNGTGLSSLVSLLGVSLSSLTEPDPETGEIEVVLLGKMAGWTAGQTAGETDGVVLELYQGEAAGDGFAITKDSFVDEDPESGPLISFAASIDECAMVSTEPSDFAFSLPVDELTIDLSLSSARLGGTIRAEDTGFSMVTSTISGYLTVSSVVQLLEALQAVCDGSEGQPDLCDGAGMFLSGDPETLANTLVLPLLRGADSTVNADGSVAAECDDSCAGSESCECAVSVCLAIESTATTITGIAE